MTPWVCAHSEEMWKSGSIKTNKQRKNKQKHMKHITKHLLEKTDPPSNHGSRPMTSQPWIKAWRASICGQMWQCCRDDKPSHVMGTAGLQGSNYNFYYPLAFFSPLQSVTVTMMFTFIICVDLWIWRSDIFSVTKELNCCFFKTWMSHSIRIL